MKSENPAGNGVRGKQQITGNDHLHVTASHGQPSSTDASQLDWALWLAGRNLFVFPIDHPESSTCMGLHEHTPDIFTCTDRGKVAAAKFTEKSTTKPQVIHATWAGSLYNVGVNCFQSGLIVIDEDQPDAFAKYAADKGVEIPETLTVKTAHGRHYYFKDTEGGTLGNHEGELKAYGINVRSGNAYVVGPGSLHKSGVMYEIENLADIATVPRWTVDAIKAGSNGHKINGDAGRYERFKLPEVIPDGKRDTVLFEYASSLLSREQPRGEAATLMRSAWERCDQPPDARDYYPVEKALEKLNRYEPGRSEGYEKRSKNGDSQDAGSRFIKVTSADDIVLKATRWIWEDNRKHWIPRGEVVGLAGREGVGKSTWCAHLTAKITKGELPGDFYGKPKGVVIVTTEDDWSATITPRLIAAGADLTKVHRIQAMQADGLEDILSLPNDLAELERVIAEYDVALVILDPLLSLVNKKLDTHKDAEVRQALEPMGRVAHNTRAAFLGLIHVNKSTEGDLMNRLMASRAIGAVVRAVLFCGNYRPIEDAAEKEEMFVNPEGPKRTRFVFGQIKNNLQAKVMESIEYHMEGKTVGHDEEDGKPIEGSFLKVDGTHPGNVEDIVLDQEKRAKATKTAGSKAEMWLVGYLQGRGEVPAGQVARDWKKAGFARNTIYRAKDKLRPKLRIRTVAELRGGTTWSYDPDREWDD